MATGIEVPLNLLEDIFRLLGYLGELSARDDLFFQKSGYSQRFEHDNALWELKLKIRQLQGQVVDIYLLTVDGITDEEMHDLEQWVAGGHSVYDNPCLIYDYSGRPLDFINACRLDAEMPVGPPLSFCDDPDDAIIGGWDEEAPF